jgi:hypothetical protein
MAGTFGASTVHPTFTGVKRRAVPAHGAMLSSGCHARVFGASRVLLRRIPFNSAHVATFAKGKFMNGSVKGHPCSRTLELSMNLPVPRLDAIRSASVELPL